jgi:regulator of sigma D
MTDIFDKILAKHKEGLAEVSQLGWSSGIKYERKRIIDLIKTLEEQQQKVLEFSPERTDATIRHSICASYQQLIAKIERDSK